MADRLVDSFAGSGGLDSHVADTGQSWRGTQYFGGGISGGSFQFGCCSFAYKEARANAGVFDHVSHALDYNRGTAGGWLGGLVLRAQAGGLGDDGGRGMLAIWFRRLDAAQVEVGFVQKLNTVLQQGNDAPGTGLVTLAWNDNTYRRLRGELHGNKLTAYAADAFTGANEIALFEITLLQDYADAAHTYYGWIGGDVGSGAMVDNVHTADAAPPATHLVATPPALSFESYDEVQPAPQVVAVTMTGAIIVGLTVVQLDGDIPLGLALTGSMTPANLTITPDVVGEGLDPGVYPCHVRLNGTNAAEPLDVLIVVQVDSPWIEGRPDAAASSWQAVP